MWRRYMELPRFLRSVWGHTELRQTLEQVSGELGFSRVCLVAGPTVTMELASRLATGLSSSVGQPLCVRDNSQAQVEELARATELRKADAAVAIGGGKTIDVAKSACDLADLPVVVVPTQLTADGIASPVSVIRASSGLVESRHARLPIGVLVDLEVVARSPVESARAGFGDLLANGCAVRDWRLAAAAGREDVDDFAALLAQAGTDLVYGAEASSLARERPGRLFLSRLLNGLVLSGLAMEVAGSSRPCSGSEHLVSHAFDRLYPGIGRHGEQVAFGAVLCTHLQGEDWRFLKGVLTESGMKRVAGGFGLSVDEIAAAVRTAPSTRPGRHTVLDEVDLGDGLRTVVAEVLAG